MSESLRNRIIWDQFREGSKEALESVYEGNYSSLYHYGMKFCHDNDLIKDIIQELFIELIDSGSRLSSTDNIRFYLLKALRNKLVKQLSENSKFTNKLEESIEFNLVSSVESQLIKNETEEKVQNQIISSIRKLTVKQQEIIYLRFFRDLSYQEIATLFEVNVQTVRNLMNRAIGSMKEDLQNKNLSKYLILFLLNIQV